MKKTKVLELLELYGPSRLSSTYVIEIDGFRFTEGTKKRTHHVPCTIEISPSKKRPCVLDPPFQQILAFDEFLMCMIVRPEGNPLFLEGVVDQRALYSKNGNQFVISIGDEDIMRTSFDLNHPSAYDITVTIG